MKNAIKLSVFAVSLLMLLAVVSPALAATSTLSLAPRIRVGTNNSSANWSGYAVTGNKGSVTSVSGSWTVPGVTWADPTTSTTTEYAAFWVGIDGYSSSTVEQTGIMANTTTTGTQWIAWFEFYPGPMYELVTSSGSPVPISPGDVITASVTSASGGGSSGGGHGGGHGGHGGSNSLTTSSVYSKPITNGLITNSKSGNAHNIGGGGGSAFTVTITDNTQGWTFSTTQALSGAARSSAEWIVETPTVSGSLASLPNFGTVTFSDCTATVSGSVVGSGSGSSITMVGNGAIMAMPSAISSTSFSDTWSSVGP